MSIDLRQTMTKTINSPFYTYQSINQSLFESDKSPYTQTHTRIHKTQYTIREETMKL